MKNALFTNKALLASLIIILCGASSTLLSQKKNESENLLLNPYFEFHSFINHREGKPISYSSHNVAFWNTEEWGDIEVIRESHVSDLIRPSFSTHNLVAISPGKKIWQFFTLPEAGLAHGEQLNLSIYGYQREGNKIRASVKLIAEDNEGGKWSPGDFGMADKRTFEKKSRGELNVGKIYSASVNKSGKVFIQINNATIPGNKPERDNTSKENFKTIGIKVEFENTGLSDTVWIYSPRLNVMRSNSEPGSGYMSMTPYYRHIPGTIQKLWKGEPIHIIVMGSSIDRGSANPPMYLYDEDPASKTYKQPLSEGLFDAVKAGRPDLDDYFGQWRHYFSYAGRLKVELMKKYNLSADKICLNFMACDGSSVGEAHSGLKEYCSLSIPPDPNMNGHKKGKTWQELYPGLFSRSGGPRPDLIIFGSGANEKTDTPDEVAVFEGTIRWIQRHHPGTEFLFCQFQNRGGYSANPGDLQALALRYQIPFMDFGKISDDLSRWDRDFSFVPPDGHPQAGGHYIWFKQLEKAFECWDPIAPGSVQLHLPERLHENSYGWEGEMVRFDTNSARIKTNRFIFEDNAINCWGKVDDDPPVIFVDGKRFESRRSSPYYDIRNSMFRYGNTRSGDRHILEVSGKNARLYYVDSKINPDRRYYPVTNPQWNLSGLEVSDFKSEWGAPYGSEKITLEKGRSIEITIICTDISVAFVDDPDGGIMEVYVDDLLRLSQPCNSGFIDTDNKTWYIENRIGIPGLNYGLHKVRISAKNNPVMVLGIFTYDSRSNRNNEKRIEGSAYGGEVLEFSAPFKCRPVVICTGGLTVKTDEITNSAVIFSGTYGNYQIIGE